jgi:hypothetical protein
MDRLIVIPQCIGILFRSIIPQGIGTEDDAIDGSGIRVIAVYTVVVLRILIAIELE